MALGKRPEAEALMAEALGSVKSLKALLWVTV